MFDIFRHSWKKFLVCGKQLITILRSKEVRMRNISQNNMLHSTDCYIVF
jgi:hypothetical protein